MLKTDIESIAMLKTKMLTEIQPSSNRNEPINSPSKFEKDNGEIHELADSEADSSEDEVDEVINLHVQTKKGSDLTPAQTEGISDIVQTDDKIKKEPICE